MSSSPLEIEFTPHFTLTNATTRDDAQRFGCVVTSWGLDQARCNLRRFFLRGHWVLVTLNFSGKTLKQELITLQDDNLYGKRWAEWSETKVEVRFDNTRDFLVSIGYPIGDYPWGKTAVIMDDKTGVAYGCIELT